jgi:hypothetical protein
VSFQHRLSVDVVDAKTTKEENIVLEFFLVGPSLSTDGSWCISGTYYPQKHVTFIYPCVSGVVCFRFLASRKASSMVGGGGAVFSSNGAVNSCSVFLYVGNGEELFGNCELDPIFPAIASNSAKGSGFSSALATAGVVVATKPKQAAFPIDNRNARR